MKKKYKNNRIGVGHVSNKKEITNVRKMLVPTQNGITLIALVVTVIILIILAAITINLIVGDSDIITRAEEAAFKTEASAMQEEYELYIANESIDGTYEVESLKAEEKSKENHNTKYSRYNCNKHIYIV